MKERKHRKIEALPISDDPGDKDLPAFMQKATHRMTKGIRANE